MFNQHRWNQVRQGLRKVWEGAVEVATALRGPRKVTDGTIPRPFRPIGFTEMFPDEPDKLSDEEAVQRVQEIREGFDQYRNDRRTLEQLFGGADELNRVVNGLRTGDPATHMRLDELGEEESGPGAA